MKSILLLFIGMLLTSSVLAGAVNPGDDWQKIGGNPDKTIVLYADVDSHTVVMLPDNSIVVQIAAMIKTPKYKSLVLAYINCTHKTMRVQPWKGKMMPTGELLFETLTPTFSPEIGSPGIILMTYVCGVSV